MLCFFSVEMTELSVTYGKKSALRMGVYALAACEFIWPD